MQCTVLPHITASVFINDDEGGLHHDHEVWLERLAPHAPISQYQHNRTGEACEYPVHGHRTGRFRGGVPKESEGTTPMHT